MEVPEVSSYGGHNVTRKKTSYISPGRKGDTITRLLLLTLLAIKKINKVILPIFPDIKIHTESVCNLLCRLFLVTFPTYEAAAPAGTAQSPDPGV